MSLKKIEYSGQIYQNLGKFLAIPDGFTFGEKLTQIEKEAKKRFYDMTDEEIYIVINFLLSTKEYYKDDKLSDEEFEQWTLKATNI
jgi:hypothetical protein